MRIANALTRQVPWRRWRLTAADYRSSLGKRARPLSGSAAPTGWDPLLAEEMAAHGVRVGEETALDDLLSDLGPV